MTKHGNRPAQYIAVLCTEHIWTTVFDIESTSYGARKKKKERINKFKKSKNCLAKTQPED